MIFKPIDAYPNNGNFIDANYNNDFTIQVQGASSKVNGFQAFIYNSDNFELVYENDTKIELSKIYVAGETISIYIPRNTLKNNMSYYWVVRLFQTTPDMFIYKNKVVFKESNNIIHVPINNSIKKGMYIKYLPSDKIDPLYYKITNVENETETIPQTTKITIENPITESLNDKYLEIYSDYIDSIEFPFYTLSGLFVNFSNDTPAIVTSRIQKFQLTTSNDISIKWYQFILKDENNDIIIDTGKIYDSLLNYSFDGLVSNNNYIIKGYICDSNNRIAETYDYSFFVEYNAPNLNLPANTEVDYNNDAVKISWVDDAYSEGNPTGEYSFVDSPIQNKKELKIDSGVIIYDSISGYPLNTSEEFTIFTDVEFTQDKKGKIIELLKQNGNYYIYVKENNIYVVKDDEETLLGKILNTEKNCLQTNNTAEENIAYIWNDEETWDDTKYWTESLSFSRRFKITILANETLIEEVV